MTCASYLAVHGGAWATKRCAQDGFWPDIAIWPGWTLWPTVQCVNVTCYLYYMIPFITVPLWEKRPQPMLAHCLEISKLNWVKKLPSYTSGNIIQTIMCPPFLLFSHFHQNIKEAVSVFCCVGCSYKIVNHKFDP